MCEYVCAFLQDGRYCAAPGGEAQPRQCGATPAYRQRQPQDLQQVRIFELANRDLKIDPYSLRQGWQYAFALLRVVAVA